MRLTIIYIKEGFEIVALCRQKCLECMEVCISGCIYLFQFKFGIFCRNSVKQATALHEHSPLLKTPLRK
jgi:hypothetical protein